MARKFNQKMEKDIPLKNGGVAYHTSYTTNQGSKLHQVYGNKMQDVPESSDMDENEFNQWLAEYGLSDQSN